MSRSGRAPQFPHTKASHLQPSEWTRILAKYREPIFSRSIFELAVTLAPFVAIWALAWWTLSISPWLAMALALANAAFLVRLFMIQHDCGHGAFFKDRRLGDWLGRFLGVLTLTPYDVWRKSHSIHHATTGNLDKRGVGDLPILTVREYREKKWIGRAMYRLVRNPIFLFGVVPFYMFFLQHRLPVGLMRSGWRYWFSAMATNVAIGAALGAIGWLGGWEVLLFVFLPTMLLAAITGMWLFYVQHQFEDTLWDHEEDWNVHDAAFNGSSHYDLPGHSALDNRKHRCSPCASPSQPHSLLSLGRGGPRPRYPGAVPASYALGEFPLCAASSLAREEPKTGVIFGFADTCRVILCAGSSGKPLHDLGPYCSDHSPYRVHG